VGALSCARGRKDGAETVLRDESTESGRGLKYESCRNEVESHFKQQAGGCLRAEGACVVKRG
jgi:hypothetical protein